MVRAYYDGLGKSRLLAGRPPPAPCHPEPVPPWLHAFETFFDAPDAAHGPTLQHDEEPDAAHGHLGPGRRVAHGLSSPRRGGAVAARRPHKPKVVGSSPT